MQYRDTTICQYTAHPYLYVVLGASYILVTPSIIDCMVYCRVGILYMLM